MGKTQWRLQLAEVGQHRFVYSSTRTVSLKKKKKKFSLLATAVPRCLISSEGAEVTIQIFSPKHQACLILMRTAQEVKDWICKPRTNQDPWSDCWERSLWIKLAQNYHMSTHPDIFMKRPLLHPSLDFCIFIARRVTSCAFLCVCQVIPDASARRGVGVPEESSLQTGSTVEEVHPGLLTHFTFWYVDTFIPHIPPKKWNKLTVLCLWFSTFMTFMNIYEDSIWKHKLMSFYRSVRANGNKDNN